MTNRMDNLQIVFDRTDWREFAKQKRALLTTMNCPEEFAGLLNWLVAIEDAAKMDGYQTIARMDREHDR